MLSFLDGTQALVPSGEIDRRAEVVRHAAALVLEVEVVAVPQHDGSRVAERRRVEHQTLPPCCTLFTTVVTFAVSSPGSGGVMKCET